MAFSGQVKAAALKAISMMRSQIFSTVLLAIFISSVSPFRTTTPRGLHFYDSDISEFVGTPLPIWTYNSSSSVNTTCQVDLMVNMSRSHIVFNRWRYYNKTRLNSLSDGKFEGMLNTMLVGGFEMPVTHTERMVYESPDYQCAVISVSLTSIGSPWYELRVRNSSITQGPNKGCEDTFMQYAHNGTRRYWDNCQSIFRQENHSRRST